MREPSPFESLPPLIESALPQGERSPGLVLPAQGTTRGCSPVDGADEIEIIDNVDDYADAAIDLGCGDDNPYQK